MLQPSTCNSSKTRTATSATSTNQERQRDESNVTFASRTRTVRHNEPHRSSDGCWIGDRSCSPRAEECLAWPSTRASAWRAVSLPLRYDEVHRLPLLRGRLQ